jgi:hypothetical protein
MPAFQAPQLNRTGSIFLEEPQRFAYHGILDVVEGIPASFDTYVSIFYCVNSK